VAEGFVQVGVEGIEGLVEGDQFFVKVFGGDLLVAEAARGREAQQAQEFDRRVVGADAAGGGFELVALI